MIIKSKGNVEEDPGFSLIFKLAGTRAYLNAAGKEPEKRELTRRNVSHEVVGGDETWGRSQKNQSQTQGGTLLHGTRTRAKNLVPSMGLVAGNSTKTFP